MRKARGIKTKKLHLPLKKMTGKEKDYAAVLLENIHHDFKAFGEVLSDVKSKGEATFEEAVRINERLFSVEITLEDIKKEIVLIKNEIKDLKNSLSKKADLARLKVLELKVARIEKHIKLST